MKAASGTQEAPLSKPPEMTWPDFLVMLLHVAAEIEHSLMVQYLYAGYSLGGNDVPVKERPMIERWRESILAIAKEEMGHLLSIQNVLTLMGAPLNLYRQDYPWDTAYYPFPFKLEPLSMQSISCYVYAEMPPKTDFDLPPGKRLARRYQEFERADKRRIVKDVRKGMKGSTPHEVGAIYEKIIDLIQDRNLIPESLFHAETFAVQASFDDWGRNYQPEPYALDAEGNLLQAPKPSKASSRRARVIIAQVASRTQALAALREISAQGEAPQLAVNETGEPSHFDRFLEIYQEFERIKWNPARNVPTNPTTNPGTKSGAHIKADLTRNWANLFNVRYRVLLSYLSHTFRLARVTRPNEPSVRAATMHRVFGEMYNLKTIAGILMRLPMRPNDNDKFAGPPFEMPYSLSLPPVEADCWRMHQAIITGSLQLCDELLRDSRVHDDGQRYLKTLCELDRHSLAWMDQILVGLRPNERQQQ